MDFEAGPGAMAGLVGGGAMILVLYTAMGIMPGQMKMDLLKILGTMVFPESSSTYVIGFMVHSAMSLVFGYLHVLLAVAFDLEDTLALWGALFGFLHWIVAGTALGMMPLVHKGIKSGIIKAPGAFAINNPKMTAMGFFLLHILFGVLVGAVYQALV